MKKEYTKPQIIIENFTLSTNLAADCEKPFTGQAQFMCAIASESNPGITIFNANLDDSACEYNGDGNKDTYDGFCYHVPTENNQLFNS